jgi:hypothetical protein
MGHGLGQQHSRGGFHIKAHRSECRSEPKIKSLDQICFQHVPLKLQLSEVKQMLSEEDGLLSGQWHVLVELSITKRILKMWY